MRLASYDRDSWELCSIEAKDLPTQIFSNIQIPELSARQNLQRGGEAKLPFRIKIPGTSDVDIFVEYMWVVVSEVHEDFYIGILCNQPKNREPSKDFYLRIGAEIPFLPEHVIGVNYPPQGYDVEQRFQQEPTRRWVRDEDAKANEERRLIQQILASSSKLFNFVDQFAGKEIIERGGSFPAFGLGVTLEGEYAVVRTETLAQKEGLEFVIQGLEKLARKRHGRAVTVAICFCKRTQVALDSDMPDTITIILESTTKPAVHCYRSYRQTEGKWEFGDLLGYLKEPIIFKDPQREREELGKLVTAYIQTKDYAKAIACLQQLLVLIQNSQDRPGEGAVFNTLGSVYYFAGNYVKAVECYQQQLIISQEIQDQQGEKAALGNLGLAYDSLGESAKVTEYFQRYTDLVD